MKHLTILIPNGQNNLSSIIGIYEILTKANDCWKESKGQELFIIELAGISKTVEFNGGLFTGRPHTNIAAIRKTDLILVPSTDHDFVKVIKENEPIISWMARQYKNGAEIASVCTGTFLLAATGLLDGKSCSTNWLVEESFRNMFPKVNLETDKLITDENGLYTNGGAYSFLNLLIYLVEKKFSRETAIYCSKVFQIEMDRQSQSPFIIFKGQKTHDDEVVKKAQTFIESNLHSKISIEHLTSMLSVSRRNFDRRFVKATGNTPIEYAQRVKIESAKKAFETSRKNINEVMYDVGYSDLKAFREVFRKITGMSPLAYRSKYNKEAAVQY